MKDRINDYFLRKNHFKEFAHRNNPERESEQISGADLKNVSID
jgi:hypothetical protein